MDPLDRKAAALHLAKVAYHVSALAKLFDPSVKASKMKGGASKAAEDGAADKPPRPKREPTPYTLYIKEQMPTFKEQVRLGQAQNPVWCQGPLLRALGCDTRTRTRALLRPRASASLPPVAAADAASAAARCRHCALHRPHVFVFVFIARADLPCRLAAHLACRASPDARAVAALRWHALLPATRCARSRCCRAHSTRRFRRRTASACWRRSGSRTRRTRRRVRCAACRGAWLTRARAQAGQKHAAAAAAGLVAAAGGAEEGEAKKLKKKHKKHDDEAGGDGDGEKKARPRSTAPLQCPRADALSPPQHKKKHKHRDVEE